MGVITASIDRQLGGVPWRWHWHGEVRRAVAVAVAVAVAGEDISRVLCCDAIDWELAGSTWATLSQRSQSSQHQAAAACRRHVTGHSLVFRRSPDAPLEAAGLASFRPVASVFLRSRVVDEISAFVRVRCSSVRPRPYLHL